MPRGMNTGLSTNNPAIVLGLSGLRSYTRACGAVDSSLWVLAAWNVVLAVCLPPRGSKLGAGLAMFSLVLSSRALARGVY